MRSRIIVGAFLATVVLTAGAFATSGHGVAPARQWAIVNLIKPTQIAGSFVAGPVLFVHDEEKMARGEPCTTVYRYDPKTAHREEVTTFLCTVKHREVPQQFRFETTPGDMNYSVMLEYQFAGDGEAHRIPLTSAR